MNWDNNSQRPVLNPLLSLVTDPRPKSGKGRSKARSNIKNDRLSTQSSHLRNNLIFIEEDFFPRASHNGRVLIYAEMFEDSLSPTFTPDDLFEHRNESEIITSLKSGYLVEIKKSSIKKLSNTINVPKNVGQEVDISRINDIKPYSTSDIYTSEEVSEIWRKATSISGKLRKLEFWLLPFKSEESRQHIASHVLNIIENENIHFHREISSEHDARERFINKLSNYSRGKNQRLVVFIDNKSKLDALMAAETIARLEPVAPFQTALPPGEGVEPTTLPTNIANAPIVGVIDGGVNAHSLSAAIAGKPETPLVADHLANFKHGNRVASTVIDASGWNNNVLIPNLPCRIVPLQILSKNPLLAPDDEQTLDYIEEQITAFPNVRVWNLSCTKPFECEGDDLSFVGSKLGQIAQDHGVLFVICAGNLDGDGTRIAPPADCERALCVGGRVHEASGRPAEACSISRCGLGPHNFQKPEVSNLSTLRTIGGKSTTGTSFAAPLISRLAAHTIDKVNNCTPDMARALIINGTDLKTYCLTRGWGTPDPTYQPWDCPTGTVTMTWTHELETGIDYYWEDIAIPQTMVAGDLLSGEISLTAVHTPRINEILVGNPILSRIEVSLQDDQGVNLLGSHVGPKGVSTDNTKWLPVRVHRKEFSRKKISNRTVRIRARIYLRDKFSLQSKLSDGRSGAKLPVAFALTFKQKHLAPNTYDLFIQEMRNKVSIAVQTDLETSVEL